MGWFVGLPNWRPALRAGEQYGVDVSAHQGSIDWPRVAGDGIRFAYIKATEGADFVDDRFDENWRGAELAGIERGAYHFFTLCTTGQAQAVNFLRVAPPHPAALAPAVDVELAGNCRARPERKAVAAELADFLATTEGAWNRKPIVYLGSDFEAVYQMRDQLDSLIWQQRFLRRPAGWRVVMWQLHGYARVEGITGRVDLDIGQIARIRTGRQAVR
ncbi:MAG: lysozyme M1 (1,4-beta-N-acetylmuramidase) [Actinomycetota bacterium]|nr:lysozyme M1 (1,4-beta-N-acetylmuramidase) [Actinomycetota bacterium]